ncbi:MAG: nitroreductase family protein [Acidimicrobiia bacterium]|nr:nitroreductase family protein [Acidimicrobiia bacterium]
MDIRVVDELLTTTRAVRKRLDMDRGVPLDVVLECLRLAIQAPTGSNAQGWRWIVVQDADAKGGLAALYRRAFEQYMGAASGQSTPKASNPSQMERVRSSAVHLAENMHRAPVLVVPCILGRDPGGASSDMSAAGLYGSIVPAIWSFQLALRSRGLGSTYTTLHLAYEAEAAELLGIPDTVTQVALLPVAYTQGTDFKPAQRRPVEEITYLDRWHNPYTG